MECNKDEAIRAKDIAEKKYEGKDLMGAKKFALKAKTLYPDLDGISQMIATLDVYISAEKTICGEPDHYGIFQLNPLADDDMIRKQFKKIALLIHPDKNKLEGAAGAFKLLTDAFDVLSDKTKRSAYNTKRHVKIAQRVPVPSQPQPTSSRPVDLKAPSGGFPSFSTNPYSNASTFEDPADGIHWYRKRPGATTSSKVKAKKRKTQNDVPVPQPTVPARDTFWTVCGRCKMQFEYTRNYLNKLLQCPNCHVGFVAKEVPAPSNLAPLRTHSFGKVHPSKGASARWTPLTSEGRFGKTTC